MTARRNAKPTAKGRAGPVFGSGRRLPSRKPRKPSRRKATDRPALRMAGRIGLLASFWFVLALTTVVVYFIARLPDPVLLTLDERPPNLTILAADGTVLAERGLRRGYVRLDRLPPYLVRAVIATEDRRFYYHLGVDPVGLVRASFRNWQAGGVVQGGSTITQQLAKNLFLTPDRTMARKLQEVIYAVWLETRFSKDEILELYLNRVYFGGGTYGVEAASRRYFGKPAQAVTLSQAALLAGLLKAPSRYAPTHNVERASARIDVVLDNMVEAGFLTADEARVAAAQPLRLKPFGDETGYPYAVDFVVDQLPDFVGDNQGDLIVETTIDASVQRSAQMALRQKLDEDGKALGASEGAVVVLDPSGGVKALGRRQVLSGKPVRPRRPRAQAARLRLQALRLSRRVRDRLHARIRSRRTSRSRCQAGRRRITNGTYQGDMTLARQLRPIGQHGRGEARSACGALACGAHAHRLGIHSAAAQQPVDRARHRRGHAVRAHLGLRRPSPMAAKGSSPSSSPRCATVTARPSTRVTLQASAR